MAAKTRQSGYFPWRSALKPINALIIALTAGPFFTTMAQAEEVFMHGPCSVTVSGERTAFIHVDRYSSPRMTLVKWYPQGISPIINMTSVTYQLGADGKLGAPDDFITVDGFVEIQTPTRSNSAFYRIKTSKAKVGGPANMVLDSTRRGSIIVHSILSRTGLGGPILFDSVDSGETWTVTVEGDTGEIFARTDVDFSALAERDRMLAQALGKIDSVDVSKCPVKP